jgi:hypothetical protein
MILKETHMPDVIEHRLEAGSKDCGGVQLAEWKNVKGLKFASQRITLTGDPKELPKTAIQVPDAWKGLGLPDIQVPNPGEAFVVEVGEVNADSNDDLYIPEVK